MFASTCTWEQELILLVLFCEWDHRYVNLCNCLISIVLFPPENWIKNFSSLRYTQLLSILKKKRKKKKDVPKGNGQSMKKRTALIFVKIDSLVSNNKYNHHPQIWQTHILGKEQNAMILCHQINLASVYSTLVECFLSWFFIHSLPQSYLFIHPFSFSLYFLPFPSLSFICFAFLSVQPRVSIIYFQFNAQFS